MALELRTSGILVKYAVETIAGTRPTSGYKTISGITAIPEMNAEPNNLPVTDLSDITYTRSIPGMIDVSSPQGLTANFTSANRMEWEAFVKEAEEAEKEGKSTWIEYYVPNYASFYYAGIPTTLGFPGAEVDSVFQGSVYITPNKVEGWGTSSTTAKTSSLT
ncbi:MAG: hypothetical protein NC122_05075 [Faecalibacterium sp.]|nr:hypothetical protein [Ruminococcus sp.]MCM1391866.1 hypothetical protein [Ruminococcus sp.]MCM1485558.1 hypothetical protein [Faecalibacterium sp.]